MTNLQHPDSPPIKSGYAFLVDSGGEMAIVNKDAIEMVKQEGEQVDDEGVIPAGTFVYLRCEQALHFTEDIFTVAGWLGLTPTVVRSEGKEHQKPAPASQILEDDDVQHA